MAAPYTRRRLLQTFAVGASAALLAACGAPQPPAKPAETKPADTKPAEAKPAAAKPTEAPAKPAAQPTAADAKPAAAKPTEHPAAAKPAPAAAGGAPLDKAGLIRMPTPAGTTPKTGGSINTARTGDFNHFDPYWTGAVQWPMGHNLYSSLFYYDEQLNLYGGLAEKWELRSGNKQLNIQLRKGVKFHNGRELTSDDIVKTVERMMDKSIGHSAYPMSVTMEGARAVDKYTVDINYKQPTAWLYDALAFVGVAAPEVFPNIKKEAIGTGPFKLKEWIPGDRAVFVKNPDYWEPGVPYIDEMIVRSFKDSPSMITNLEAGQLDLIEPLPNNEVDRLEKAKYGVIPGNPGFFYNLYLTLKKPPFDNKIARQAMAWAIDRQAIVDQVLYGKTVVQLTPYPKNSWAYDESLQKYYGFDLEKAAKLFAEAGVKPSDELVVISTPIFPELTDMAVVLQASLKKINVNLKIQELPSAQYYEKLFGGFEDTGHAMLSFSGRAHKDPGSVYVIQPVYKNGGNMLGWQSDKFEQLQRQGSEEFDREKRRKTYLDIQEHLLDEAMELIIAQRLTYYGLSPKLKDFRFGIDGDWYMHRLWKE